MNLLTNLPQNLPEELTTVLQDGTGVRIERIISTGHRSPDGFWFAQPEHEWVMVLTGAAKLAFEDRVVEMLPGDTINIPAHHPTPGRVDIIQRAYGVAGGFLLVRVSGGGGAGADCR